LVKEGKNEGPRNHQKKKKGERVKTLRDKEERKGWALGIGQQV